MTTPDEEAGVPPPPPPPHSTKKDAPIEETPKEEGQDTVRLHPGVFVLVLCSIALLASSNVQVTNHPDFIFLSVIFMSVYIVALLLATFCRTHVVLKIGTVFSMFSNFCLLSALALQDIRKCIPHDLYNVTFFIVAVATAFLMADHHAARRRINQLVTLVCSVVTMMAINSCYQQADVVGVSTIVLLLSLANSSF